LAAQELTREDIEAGFRELGDLARTAGKVIDLAVYGGVAMILGFDARPATRDVDAVARGDPQFVREAVAQIARSRGWTERWLNDAVKGFLSEHDSQSLTLFRTYPSEATPGLRAYLARPEYLLAMKCIAMRVDQSESSRDRDDIKALITHLGLTRADQVLDIVTRYYPKSLIRPKTQFGIEEIMDQLASEGRT
jgi:hypothetical protein